MDRAGGAIYTAVSRRNDETGEVVSAGSWEDVATGTVITDPARIARLEAEAMAKGNPKETYEEGDRVEILDDDGEGTGKVGDVIQVLGAGVYLVQVDGERTPTGHQPAFMKRVTRRAQ